MKLRHSALRGSLASLILVALSAPASAQRAGGQHWVATWAAAPQQPVVLAPPPPGSNSRGPVFQELKGFHDQTVRMVVRVSLGGRRIRVRLSNAHGRGPLMVGAAHVALHGKGSAIVPGSDRVLLFNGKATAMIPAGAQMVSDRWIWKCRGSATWPSAFSFRVRAVRRRCTRWGCRLLISPRRGAILRGRPPSRARPLRSIGAGFRAWMFWRRRMPRPSWRLATRSRTERLRPWTPTGAGPAFWRSGCSPTGQRKI